MRIATYRVGDRSSFGVIDGDRISDLATPALPDLETALAVGPLPLRPATLALADITLLPVVTAPRKIFCVGHNYEEHRLETNGPRVGHPPIFTRFADTLTPDNGPIICPASSTMLDYEGELAVVVGKGGRHISEADAMDHVAGFTCANDASVRDWQRHTGQFTPGKNFPATCGLGPWLVTPDEIDELGQVTLTTRLNGTIMQQGHIEQMIFPIPTIIAYLSAFTPLSPGDLILTGTPGGVGARRDPPLWMKPGDRVEIEISAIGTLSNDIVAERV